LSNHTQRRLKQLNKTFEEKRDINRLLKGETKLGETGNCMVVGPGRLTTHQEAPANAGWTFTNKDGELRAENLVMTTNWERVYFTGGLHRLNPLGEETASSTTDPLPTIVPNFPQDSIWALSGLVQTALQSLKDLA